MQKRNSCPLCKSNNFKKVYSLFKNNSHEKIYLCKSCGLAYLNSLSRQNYKDYYTNLYRDNKNNLDSNSNNEKQKLEKSKKLWSVFSNSNLGLEKNTQVLDIGCAKGYFLDVLKENNLKTYGIEPGQHDAHFASEKGHIVHNGAFDSNSFLSNTFDLITCFNVVEHVIDIESFIGTIYKKLNENGMFIVGWPCLDYLPIHKGSGSLFATGHVNFFTINALLNLLQKEGFDIVKKIPSKEYNDIYRPGKSKSYAAIICRKGVVKVNRSNEQNLFNEAEQIFKSHMKESSYKNKILQKAPYIWKPYSYIKKIQEKVY